MKVVFIGFLAPQTKTLIKGSSAAGNQVQIQILNEVSRSIGNENVICYAMAPNQMWPRGPLLSRSMHEENIEFISYLNLPLLRHLFFSFKLIIRLLKYRPDLCIQYNSYLLENIILLFYRLSRKTKLAVIIQDIHTSKGLKFFTKFNFRSLSERLSLLAAKYFDLCIPISSNIIHDFNFEKKKCIVFQGGVTNFAQHLIEASDSQIADIAVFAGGLSPHNGIDLLIEKWISDDIRYSLHIFGRGSLEEYVKDATKRSNYIIYHGFQNERVIFEWQSKARWNFCLRFSRGLNQEYFFPSKLFNILCAPGAVVTNDFNELPLSIRNYITVVQDDLSNLSTCLEDSFSLSSSEIVNERRKIVQIRHSWSTCVNQIINTLFRKTPTTID